MQEYAFAHRHLLAIDGLSREDIEHILDLADTYVELSRQADKKTARLRGRTLINCFFENSTRTRTSFEVAGKRLGADVINMAVQASSMRKGETLIDTAMTLNAMHPDVLVVRHPESGAVQLLSEKVDCAVVNAGDGSHEHPTQALLDALIMHPGPMNRGVEIGSEVADDIDRSLIRHQVEMGVAVRMACLEILARDLGNGPPLQ